MKTRPKDKDEQYAQKEASEMFCHACATRVSIDADICPKCGAALRFNFAHRIRHKEKSTAVILAIFTSFFSWLYLYERSEIKFWIGAGVSIMSALAYLKFSASVYLIPGALIWIIAVIDCSIKKKSYFDSF